MVRRDGAEARKERITKISAKIQSDLFKNSEVGYIPLKKTIASLELETGLTREKIMEYLEVLQEVGLIEIEQDVDRIRKPRV